MCTILFAYKTHPEHPLILAGNRDEFYERPTGSLAWWEEHPHILAGKDLQAGGTWMGISRSGRWAALTNYRQFPNTREYSSSRGKLVLDFINGSTNPEAYSQMLEASAEEMDGYNLLYGTANELYHYSNRGSGPMELKPGLYGVSNALLDTPWPKVEQGKQSLEQLIAADAFHDEGALKFLQNRSEAADELLPSTGIGLEWERKLSAVFIETERYGTMCSSLLTISKSGQVQFLEKNYRNQTTRLERFQTQ